MSKKQMAVIFVVGMLALSAFAIQRGADIKLSADVRHGAAELNVSQPPMPHEVPMSPDCKLRYLSIDSHFEDNGVVFGPGTCGEDIGTTAKHNGIVYGNGSTSPP